MSAIYTVGRVKDEVNTRSTSALVLPLIVVVCDVKLSKVDITEDIAVANERRLKHNQALRSIKGWDGMGCILSSGHGNNSTKQ